MRLFELIQEDELDQRGEMCSVCSGGRREGYSNDCPNCGGEGYVDKEELEEIKVTKTLAGKRKRPSETLAGKKNKEKKNAGKPAVSLKTRDAHELANITLKGEYTS